MSAYLKIGSYLLALVLGFASGYYVGADRWEVKYNALQAEDWKGKADRLAIQNTALADDLKKAQATAATNAEVIHGLQKQSASIQADRDALATQLARVLTRQTGPGSGGMPQGGKPGTAATRPDTGTNEVAGLLADALTECRLNNANHDGLVTQLKPQL